MVTQIPSRPELTQSWGQSYAELTPELTRSLRGQASYADPIFEGFGSSGCFGGDLLIRVQFFGSVGGFVIRWRLLDPAGELRYAGCF